MKQRLEYHARAWEDVTYLPAASSLGPAAELIIDGVSPCGALGASLSALEGFRD